MITVYNTANWNETHSQDVTRATTEQLEDGHILYFPQLAFTPNAVEKKFITPDILGKKSKNVGYCPMGDRLWGVADLSETDHAQLKGMLARYYQHAQALVDSLFPHYTANLIKGRTSFRPAQISHRKTSYRKDDKRLHVDAFPSSPNQGKRIIRVFCNINPTGEERVWRIGEPFTRVAERFLPHIRKPIPGFARALQFLKITKSYRTPYDHYMLYMHDTMKADLAYQKNAMQQEVRFPPNTTWVVHTDQVSHAAMSGQHMLEQTFYLPVEAMLDESKSPLRILEKMLGKELV
jgi:hypothetical protein